MTKVTKVRKALTNFSSLLTLAHFSSLQPYDIGEFSLKNKTSTLVVTLLFIVGGMYSYSRLGRLEDPEFTIKTAVVITQYPGATAEEVEQEVTDLIEQAVQQMGQLEDVQSQSQKGLSIVTANMKDMYDKHTLPQVWDELRRKINDVQGYLRRGPARRLSMMISVTCMAFSLP